MAIPPGLRRRGRSAFVAASRLVRQASLLSWRVVPRTWRRPVEVVDSFDSWAYQSELTNAISALLERSRIEHLVLTDRLLPRPLIAVRGDDSGRLRRLLAEDPGAAKWWVAPSLSGHIGRARPARSLIRPIWGRTGLVVSRNLVSANGLPLTHSELGVLVEFWGVTTEPTATAGGGELAPGSLVAPIENGILGHAGPGLWQHAQDNGHRPPAAAPHLLVVHEPVDLVYTWVDGNDPAWLARKATALGKDLSDYTDDAAIDARFEHRDELKYSLRSVQMFANWANHIWVVTDRQVPDWLLQDDRLTVVDHSKIFSDPAALPVFNSHAIESQLHHIPGLADRYLYLNDDMLFGAPVRPEDFFHANGISKFFTSPALVDLSGHTADDVAVAAAAKNNRDLLEAEFGRTITNKLRHTAQPQLRFLIAEFEATHRELFDSVMRSKLRHAGNYSLTSSLNQYYVFAGGRAVTAKIAHAYLDLASDRAELMLELWLRTRNQQCLCVNDSGDDDPAVRPAKDAALRDFFRSYYPVPSRWERPPCRSTTSAATP